MTVEAGQVYVYGVSEVKVEAVDGNEVTYRLDGRPRTFTMSMNSLEAWLLRTGARLR